MSQSDIQDQYQSDIGKKLLKTQLKPVRSNTWAQMLMLDIKKLYQAIPNYCAVYVSLSNC